MLPGKRYNGLVGSIPSPRMLLAFALDGALDSRITYTRSSSGTRFDYNAVMQTESTDTARFTHDPATYYPSSTSNSISRGKKTFAVSYQYTVGAVVQATYDASNWMRGTVIAASGSSVTIRVENTSGSGTYSAWNLIQCLGLLIEESRTNLLLNSETLGTQVVTVSATAYTLSFYGTGTITLSGVSSAGPLVGTASNELVTLTFTPSAGSLTLTVSGSVKYANLEAGSFATSWIPTTGSTATRAADNASITGSNFSSWYNQAEGSVVINARTAAGIGPGSNQYAFCFNDGTNNNMILANRLSALSAIIVVSGLSQASFDGFSSGNSTDFKVGFSFAVNDSALTVDARTLQTDSSLAIPTVDRMTIANRADGARAWNSTIASIAYYPKALPGYLQYLTS